MSRAWGEPVAGFGVAALVLAHQAHAVVVVGHGGAVFAAFDDCQRLGIPFLRFVQPPAFQGDFAHLVVDGGGSGVAVGVGLRGEVVQQLPVEVIGPCYSSPVSMHSDASVPCR